MIYLIAVDSGGTRTNLRIVDPDGKPIDFPELVSVIDPVRSIRGTEETFSSVFAEIEAYIGSAPRSVWISAAGYSEYTRDTIEARLENYLNFPGRLGIANDGVSLTLAYDEHTVIAVVGTGSVVMARSSTNVISQLGGRGWVATDYGSGFWIGLEGIRVAYRAFEGGPQTSLKNRLVDHYRKLAVIRGDADQLTIPRLVGQLAHLGDELKRQVASFASVVCDVAQRSDAEAQQIVRQAAEEVADLVARMYRGLVERTDSRGVIVPKVVLCGSVVSLSPFFQNAFRSRLNLDLSDVIQDLHLAAVDVELLFSGIDDSVKLAQRLSEEGGRGFPELDPIHPVKIYENNVP